MFPLQRSGELCFSISSSSNQQPDPTIILEQDLFKIITHNNNNNNGVAAAAVSVSAPQIITGGSQKALVSAANNKNMVSCRKRLATKNEEETATGDCSKKKKHREVEKQRRDEMASLFVGLRSLLPLEFIRGKRSISDHINEAVNYIRHLQANMKELEAKRNALKRISSNNPKCRPRRRLDSEDRIMRKSSNSCDSSSSTNSVIVQPWCGGTQILISRGSLSEEEEEEEVFPLSVVMELLSQQGLNIVSCLSSQVMNNTTTLYNIYCEASEETTSSPPMNLTELCKKLEEVIG